MFNLINMLLFTYSEYEMPQNIPIIIIIIKY